MAEISTVAAEQNRTLAPLTDDLSLAESGLDSLCFAILVARLEDITGDDPLTSAGDGRFPRTVGEFITLYEEAPTRGGKPHASPELWRWDRALPLSAGTAPPG